MEIDLLCNLFDQSLVTEFCLLPSEDEEILCRFFGHLSITGVLLPSPSSSSYNISPIDHLIDSVVSCLPSEDEELLCRIFGRLNISGDECLLPTIYSISPVGYHEGWCNLNHRRRVSGGHGLSNDEDLIWRSFGSLNFSGDLLLLPSSYSTNPVGQKEDLSNSNGSDHGLHGSCFFSWAKDKGLPWCSLKAHYGTHCYYAGLLFLGRQLKRDFFLFISYSGVRQKNDWLAFGYFQEDKRLSDISFHILWRYGILAMLLVFSVILRRFCSCSFFPIEFPWWSISGGFICYGDQSSVLHLNKIKDPVFVSLSVLFFIHVPPLVLSPPKTRSGSVSVNFPGNIRLLVYYVSSVVQGDVINVIGSDHGLYLVIFLFTLVPCFVVWDVMMVCLKKGDDLLRQNWYPKFEIHSSGEPKSFIEYFRRSNEDDDHFWPFGIFPLKGVFITSAIKNFLRVVNHAPAIQAHPYVCGMLQLVVTGYFGILVTEFWLQDLGSVNHLVSCPVFTFSHSCQSWGEMESSSMLDSFPRNDRTSY